MCGIFAILDNSNFSNDGTTLINKSFSKGAHRGPESSDLRNVMLKSMFGFHRLAINGLNPESSQPILYKDVVLICNGEIYNYKELYSLLKIKPKTDSDCEIIIHLYIHFGIEQTLELLDGVFAFCLLDYRLTSNTSKMFVARDPYGVRPLYMMKPTKRGIRVLKHKENYVIASEMKMINDIYQAKNEVTKEYNTYEIQQVKPGTYSYFEMYHNVFSTWDLKEENNMYHHTAFSSCKSFDSFLPKDEFNKYVYDNIQKYLINAVEKRCCTTERPIACLLSGGLDSSLIAAIVNEYHKKNDLPTLETYSIGIEGSEDLIYSQKMADYLGTKHTQITLQEKDFLDAIPDVIKDIESYDTTTVRASIGNWLIGKHISNNSEAKVIFNGDGADELMGGYLYIHKSPNVIEFDKECKSLLKYIHTFDVLRSDKCISSHGLEPRTPFLDREWTQFYLSIPLHLRCSIKGSKNKYDDITSIEKNLIREAFSKENYLNSNGMSLLPEEILNRQKEAFSDGVSCKKRSLFDIVGDHAKKFIQNNIQDIEHLKNYQNIKELTLKHPDMKKIQNHLLPNTYEQFYYRYLFEQQYPGLGYIIPKFWMPKYSKVTDPSARKLDCY